VHILTTEDLMDRKDTHKAIIGRVEHVRNHLGMNKSQFSQKIGMRPQTYNNFIGGQGSKPSVDLLVGIVERFGVNGDWLLTGQGRSFLKDRSRLTQPRQEEFESATERMKRLRARDEVISNVHSSDLPVSLNPQLGETVLRIPHSLVENARRIIVELREPKNRTEGGDMRISIGDAGQSAEYLTNPGTVFNGVKMNDILSETRCFIHDDPHTYGSPACDLARRRERDVVENPKADARDQAAGFQPASETKGGEPQD
jgi:transcriptional regulator with XRE-family HTH domain